MYVVYPKYKYLVKQRPHECFFFFYPKQTICQGLEQIVHCWYVIGERKYLNDYHCLSVSLATQLHSVPIIQGLSMWPWYKPLTSCTHYQAYQCDLDINRLNPAPLPGLSMWPWYKPLKSFTYHYQCDHDINHIHPTPTTTRHFNMTMI